MSRKVHGPSAYVCHSTDYAPKTAGFETVICEEAYTDRGAMYLLEHFVAIKYLFSTYFEAV